MSRVDRRTFLVEAAVVASAFALGGALPAAAVMDEPAMPVEDLAKLAAFLTGKLDLSTELVVRAHQALVAEGASFDQRLATLNQRIKAAGPSDVEAFKTRSLANDPELMATAIAVISAFYTGRVGKTYRGHLVSYEEALMYRPTADVTVIPTYSHGAPGYWAKPPLL